MSNQALAAYLENSARIGSDVALSEDDKWLLVRALRSARRYEWLRENVYVEGYYIDGAGGVDTMIRVRGGLHFLDMAIDKEMDDDKKRTG